MTEELIPLLGEIRDQLKRIADILERPDMESKVAREERTPNSTEFENSW